MVLFSLWWVFQLEERDTSAFGRAGGRAPLLKSHGVEPKVLSMGKQKHPEVGFTDRPKVVAAVVVVVMMGIRKIDA